jgi:hypothetical protein
MRLPELASPQVLLGMATAVGLGVLAWFVRGQGSFATLPSFIAWMMWAGSLSLFLWSVTGQRLPLIGVGAVWLGLGLFGYWYVRRIESG